MIKNSIVYLFTNGISRGIPFLMLPFLTSYLTKEELGYWSIFQVLISFIIPLVGLSLNLNITRKFFSLEKEELAKLISNLFFILFSTFMLFILIVNIVFLKYDYILGLEKKWYIILVFIGFTNMIILFNQTILRNQKKSFLYGLIEITKTITYVGSAIIFIIIINKGWEGMVFGYVLANSLTSFFSVLLILRNKFFIAEIRIGSVKKILKIALPILPHSLGAVIINLSDRMFVDQMIGKETLAIYSVGFTFGMIVFLFTDSFNKAYSPWIYKKLSIDFDKIKIVKIIYLYIISVIILCLSITYISQILLSKLISIEYITSQEYIVWSAFSYGLQGIYFMLFPFILHTGKTKLQGVITFMAAIINIIGNYYLININGALGAAQSTIIAYLFMVICVWVYANKCYPLPWLLRKYHE